MMNSTTCPCCGNEDCGRTWYKTLFAAVFILCGTPLGAFLLPLLILCPLVSAAAMLKAIAALGSQERKCDVCAFTWQKVTWLNSEKKIAKLARKHAIKKRIQAPA